MWGSNEKGQLGLPAAADVAAQASVSPAAVTQQLFSTRVVSGISLLVQHAAVSNCFSCDCVTVLCGIGWVYPDVKQCLRCK